MAGKNLRNSRTPAMTETEDAVDSIREMAAAVQQLVGSSRTTPEVHGQGEPRELATVREFKRQNPPSYGGEPNPLVAESWLEQIERILDTLGIMEDKMRVNLDVYQFTGEAYHWWKMVKRGQDMETLTWDEFKDLFLRKHFPEGVRDAKLEEFLSLAQKEKSVMAYEAKFAELSRFALALTEDEAMKTKRFVKGLRPYIRSKLVPLSLRSYSEAVDRAILVEEEMKDTERIIGSKRDGQRNQGFSGVDNSKK